MPTYDYRCKACEHEFEEFQSMSAKPLVVCPECDEKALERLIGTGAGLIFKGSGFYETDYRSDSYKKAAEKDSNSSDTSTSDSKAKSNTESKPKAGEKSSKGDGAKAGSSKASSGKPKA